MQSAQKSNPRLPPAKDTPLPLNHSFESAESASAAKPPLKASLRTPRASEMRPMKAELRDLELLQSSLLQWSFANALHTTSCQVLSSKVEEEVFDRGQQLIELQKQVHALDSDLSARRQTRLLDEVLTSEYSSLKPIDTLLESLSEPITTLEKASYYSLHRLKLGRNVIVEPMEMLRTLRNAYQHLESIADLVRPESEEVMQLTARLKNLTELVGVEREEVKKAAQLLEEMKDLSGEEKGALAFDAQMGREEFLTSILSEKLTLDRV